MQVDKRREHVVSFLSPADPPGTILRFGEFLLAASDRDGATADAVRHAADWVERQLGLLDAHFSETAVQRPADDSARMTIFAVSYLRAKELLRGGSFNVSSALRDISRSGVADFDNFVNVIEEDFFVYTVTETDRRAVLDFSFRTRLTNGKEDVRRITSHLSYILMASELFKAYQKTLEQTRETEKAFERTGVSILSTGVDIFVGVMIGFTILWVSSKLGLKDD